MALDHAQGDRAPPAVIPAPTGNTRPLETHPLVRLQQCAGNAAVVRLVAHRHATSDGAGRGEPSGAVRVPRAPLGLAVTIQRGGGGQRGGADTSGPRFQVRGGRVTLYRAVGLREAAEILRYGDFGYSPHGGGKYFCFTETDARNAAKALYGPNVTVVETSVPRAFIPAQPGVSEGVLHPHISDPRVGPGAKLIRGETHVFYDPRAGGWSLHVDDEALDVLNTQKTRPNIVHSPAPTVRGTPGGAGGTPGGAGSTSGGSGAPVTPSGGASKWRNALGGFRASLVPTAASIAGEVPLVILFFADRAAATEAVRRIQIKFTKEGFAKGFAAGVMGWSEAEVRSYLKNRITLYRVRGLGDAAGILKMSQILQLAEAYENQAVDVGYLFSSSRTLAWKKTTVARGMADLRRHGYHFGQNPAALFEYGFIDKLASALDHITDPIVDAAIESGDKQRIASAAKRIGF